MSKKKEKQNTTHDRNSALTTYIRIGIIALAILLQLGIMMFTTYFLRANAAPLYVALDILAMVTVFSLDRKSTRLNSSHPLSSRMPSSA